MSENIRLVEKFYSAFADGDLQQMLACYHPDIQFTDPVFGNLNARETASMWKMLLSRGGDDLTIRIINAEEKENSVEALWEADYEFSSSGRYVENKIRARMEIKDGLIYRHVDHFDLHRWASMAFGIKGTLFGGFPFFKNAIRKKAKYHLQKFQDGAVS